MDQSNQSEIQWGKLLLLVIGLSILAFTVFLGVGWFVMESILWAVENYPTVEVLE